MRIEEVCLTPTQFLHLEMGDGRWEMGDGRWEMGGYGELELGKGKGHPPTPACE